MVRAILGEKAAARRTKNEKAGCNKDDGGVKGVTLRIEKIIAGFERTPRETQNNEPLVGYGVEPDTTPYETATFSLAEDSCEL
jgi:hypothetical protein